MCHSSAQPFTWPLLTAGTALTAARPGQSLPPAAATSAQRLTGRHPPLNDCTKVLTFDKKFVETFLGPEVPPHTLAGRSASVHPTTHHPSNRLSNHPPPTIHPATNHPSIHPSNHHPSIHPPTTHPFIHPTTHHPSIQPPNCQPSINSPVHPTIIHPSKHPSSIHPSSTHLTPSYPSKRLAFLNPFRK